MGGGGGEEHVRGISELSTVFTVIFVITLLAQLLYILLRRQRQSTSSNAVSYPAPSSKAGHDSNTNSNNECPIISSSVLKLHGMFGPPRFLFTIKEEDDEEGRAEEEEDENASNVSRVMSLKRCLDAADDGDVEGGSRNGGGGTPCGSPAFFSPVHAAVAGGSRDEEMGLG